MTDQERLPRIVECPHCHEELSVDAARVAAPSDGLDWREEYEREARAHGVTIDQRDVAQDWADRLAAAIGGAAIGEHSNLNNPWQNALDMATTEQREGLDAERLTELLDEHWLDFYPQASPPVALCTCGEWRLDVDGPKPFLGQRFAPFSRHVADVVLAARTSSHPAR